MNRFMEKLEATGAFANLLSREERVNDQGLLEAALETKYVPAAGARERSNDALEADPRREAIDRPVRSRSRCSSTSACTRLVVYPLGAKSASAAARAESAGQSLGAAERDQAAARALVTGKSRADQELATFYQKVLAGRLDRRAKMTYTRVPDLAQKANVHMLARHSEIDQEPSPRTGDSACKTRGAAGRLRRHPPVHLRARDGAEFVIIDDVSLAQSRGEQAADADARAVHLLPPWSQWHLSAAGSSSSSGVLVVLGVAAYRLWPGPPAAAPPASNGRARPWGGGARAGQPAAGNAVPCISRRSTPSGPSRRRSSGICSGSSPRPTPAPPPMPAPRRPTVPRRCRPDRRRRRRAADRAEVHRDGRSGGARREDRGLERFGGARFSRARRGYHRGPVSHPEDRRRIPRHRVSRRHGPATMRLTGDRDAKIQISDWQMLQDCRLQT